MAEEESLRVEDAVDLLAIVIVNCIIGIAAIPW